MFGDLIKEVRKELGITQEKLAHELDISFSTINRWENGHTSPSRLAKRRLLDFCKNNNANITIISKLEEL